MSLQKTVAPELPEKNKIDLPASPTGIQGELEHPPDLSPEQWTKDIVDFHQLLTGWNFEGDEPKKVGTPAFEMNQSKTVPRYMGVGEARVNTELTYTERSANYIHSGFQKETATASYAFVSASVEHSRKERIEETSESKTLHITAHYDYPVITLWFKTGNKDYQIKPTKDFLDAVDEALKAGPNSDKYSKLCEVFKEYGQVFATEVTLGGRLYTKYDETFKSDLQETTLEQNVKAAMNVKVGKFAADAGFEQGSSEQQKKEALALVKKLDIESIGGVQTKVTELDKWISSLASHIRWFPISLDTVVPTYTLLDKKRQDAIQTVLDSVMDDPPMRLRRFTAESKAGQHHADCTLKVPPGYKIISGGARVIDDQPAGKVIDTILNMLWASYPILAKDEHGKDKDWPDSWRADSWDCQVDHVAHIEISVIALYDPFDDWNVKVFHDKPDSRKQDQEMNVAVDKGYDLTGGGAEVFDSTVLAHDGWVNSFLVASYPNSEKRSWVALSHDHLRKDYHKLRVYAIGVQPKNGQPLDIQYWPKASGEVEEQYPRAEARPDDDYALVGGGAAVDKKVNHHLLASYPFTTSDPWRASGWKAHSTDHEIKQPAILTAYAIGVKGAIFDKDLP